MPVAESQVLNKTLHDLDVTTQLIVESGLGHGFLTGAGYNPDPVLTQAVSFINSNLLSSLYFQNDLSLGILGVNPVFLPTAWQGVGVTSSGWQQRAIADVDGDGVPDILFQNGTSLAVMLMNANGTSNSWMTLASAPQGWQLRGASDIAGNGSLDLIFQNGAVLNYMGITTAGKETSSGTIGTMGNGLGTACGRRPEQ